MQIEWYLCAHPPHPHPSTVPVPTYILGPVKEHQLQHYSNAPGGGEICPNVHYLGMSIFFKKTYTFLSSATIPLELGGERGYAAKYLFEY